MDPKPLAAPSLGSWPADIWYLVFKLLSPAEFRALCRVNKMFCALAEPFLYSKIQWIWLTVRLPATFLRFLETLISKPYLATYITDIHLGGDTFRYQEFRRPVPIIPIPDEDLEEPIAFIRRTGVPFADMWIQELHNRTIDAFVALLLAQTPNLKSLYLGHNFTQNSLLTGMVLRSSICEPADHRLPNFEHLRDVYFLLADSSDMVPGEKVQAAANPLPFFYVPNLKHMSASIENPDTFTWPAAHPPVASNLKSLDLNWVRETYLGELLSATPTLETLRWHWYFDSGVEDQFITKTLDLDRLTAAMSHVRGTLTDLTISAEVSIGGSDQFYPAMRIMGSLQEMVEFDALKKLQIPWPLLVGFTKDLKRLQDVMPKNIESLTITDDLRLQNEDRIKRDLPVWDWTHSAIVDVLRLWMKDWKTCTPHLRRVSLVISVLEYEPDDWASKLTHQLGVLSDQSGVQLELINMTGEM
ncbi:hypothetical protein P170DRAFT_464416 [Aspergillus steynii IBT 23096]|uniref:F-box domain-containing protein n=1 Tax=Aspergillus steynii IBT 23096 TaxID=1392250 RepID=A0A2I2G7F2_9EURO|nr:uncharacterized protein P170DRAFT_464416 [Aspergillus steynii IBT 23096]PLB48817.1 hypothetical protein P170DRAFT_464416 [Aspergillus steynii IBT 23096]